MKGGEGEDYILSFTPFLMTHHNGDRFYWFQVGLHFAGVGYEKRHDLSSIS